MPEKITLEARLAKAKAHYEDLLKKADRKRLGIPCPSMADHETECHQVALAGLSSYQVHECLVCGQWILAKYAGEMVKIIPESEAQEFIKPGGKVPTEGWWRENV